MNNRGIIQFVTLNVVVALLLAGLIAFDRWLYPVYGSYDFLLYILLILLCGLTGLLAIIGGLLAVMAKSQPTFRLGLVLTTPFVSVLGLWVWSAVSETWIREPLFARQLSVWLMTEEPVVSAIQAYEATNHALPVSIEDLQPTYLFPPDWPNVNRRAIPAAAIGLDNVQVTYEYCLSQINGQSTWILYLEMPAAPNDWPDFMHLMYRPDQQYNPNVPVLGGWALIERDTESYADYC